MNPLEKKVNAYIKLSSAEKKRVLTNAAKVATKEQQATVEEYKQAHCKGLQLS